MSATQLVHDEELGMQAPPGGGATPPPARPWAAALLPATVAAALASLLTTAAMFAVMRPGDWFARAVGAVLLVAVTGAVARTAGAPRSAVVAAQAGASVAYLTALYAAAPATAGVLPLRGQAWAQLGRTFEEGLLQLGALAPPVPATPQITLVALAGVALTAVLVDALAVTYRKPAVAGLPLLTAYLLLAGGLPDGLPVWYFVLPATGYLVLLLAEGGRAGGARLGRLIVPSVLALAVGIPAVTPALPEGALSRLTGSGAGNRTISTLNPLVDLRRDLLRADDFPVLSLRTDASHPDELYLRTVTLDQFDGERWTFGRRQVESFSTELPTPPGVRDEGAIPVETTISIGDRLASDYLPLPYPALSVDVPGSWRVDPATGNVVSREGRRQLQDTTYGVTSIEVPPPDLDAVASAGAVFGPYTALPDDLPGEVAATAREVTRGTSTPLEAALALQAWFRDRDNFTYDLSVAPGTGAPAILDFLRDRRGYCEQFAATMAVMARTLGIPARVNVGFTSGEPNANGSRTVSSRDAHAWPELELPGLGWTRFEPTPAAASSDPSVPSWMDVQDEAGGTDEQEPAPAPEDPAEPTPEPVPTPAAREASERPACTGAEADDPACLAAEPPPAAGDGTGGADGGLGARGTAALVGAGLLLLGLPAAGRAVIRRRRWAAAGAAGGRAAEAAWREVRDDALDLGYSWPASHTPRQAAEALAAQAHLTGAGADALAAIRATVERARYARGEPAGQPGSDLRPTVALLRRELAAGVARPARVRARVLPPSLLLRVGATGAGAAARPRTQS